jgi:hypothetical protein
VTVPVTWVVELVTCAVNVTAWPCTEGFSDEVRIVPVVAGRMSPSKIAVSDSVPAGGDCRLSSV